MSMLVSLSCGNGMINFSVLMSIYYKETSSNLEQCFESLITQTVAADEIVVVKDGILTNELEEILLSWKRKLPLKIIGYNENKGLSYALNFGLSYCSYDLVARMDSDDICVPDRFGKQVCYFENHPDVFLVSGYINEFYNQPNDIHSVRKVPVGHLNIQKGLKNNNAFNHMAVMFRKQAVFAVGGYGKIDFFEDYDLWIRLVQANYKVDNIPEILVYARIGNNMIMRRRGFSYIRKEVQFLYRQRKGRFISILEFIRLLLIRIPVRLMPEKIIKYIYMNYLRNRET